MSGPSGASIGPENRWTSASLQLSLCLKVQDRKFVIFHCPVAKECAAGFFNLLFSIYYFPLLGVCLQWMVDFQFVQSIFDRPLGENAENQ